VVKIGNFKFKNKKMATNKNGTLIIGLVSLLLIGGASYLVIKTLRKKTETEPPPPPKKKGQVFIGDTMSSGIGQPNEDWIKNTPLGLGETIKSWFGNLAKGTTFTTQTDLGQKPIEATEVKSIDFKKTLSQSLRNNGNSPIKLF
jgi:hypothetical protein